MQERIKECLPETYCRFLATWIRYRESHGIERQLFVVRQQFTVYVRSQVIRRKQVVPVDRSAIEKRRGSVDLLPLAVFIDLKS